MGAISSFRELVAWQKGIELVKMIYQISALWPDAERFGLTSQIRRAAISIPSNVAEGFGRKSNKDFARFLAIAYGSLMELETQLQIAAELGYISRGSLESCFTATEEVARVINGLARSVRDNITGDSQLPARRQ